MKLWLCLLFAASSTVAAPLDIVILGDSMARGTGDETGLGLAGNLARELSGRFVNLAVNGSRTWNLSTRLEVPDVRDAIRRADAVVMSIGGNDLFGSSRERLISLVAPRLSMSLVAARLERLVRRIHTLNSKARIIVLGVYNPYAGSSLGPTVERLVQLWSSTLFARFATHSHVTVMSIADIFHDRRRISRDRFHPGAEGYARIAARIAGGF